MFVCAFVPSFVLKSPRTYYKFDWRVLKVCQNPHLEFWIRTNVDHLYIFMLFISSFVFKAFWNYIKSKLRGAYLRHQPFQILSPDQYQSFLHCLCLIRSRDIKLSLWGGLETCSSQNFDTNIMPFDCVSFLRYFNYIGCA